MLEASLPEGTAFARRYTVGRPLAAGGMGAVYEAVHMETGRRCALKVMLPQLLDDAEMCERFQREARLASQVNSKFIADVFDAGVDHDTGMPFLVMELLRGEDLGERLKRAGAFPQPEALVYLHQIALALAKTHKAGIVHRDLKPANLFLVESDDEPPHIKILDFGLAKILAEGKSSSAGGVVFGTPLYMAPEQFSRQAITPAVDIYAFGLLAYALLVGKAYWSTTQRHSRDPVSFAQLAALGPDEPPCRRAAKRGVELPSAFDAWFAMATAVAPANRFSTALEAVTALSGVLGIPLPAYGRAASGGPGDGRASGPGHSGPPGVAAPSPAGRGLSAADPSEALTAIKPTAPAPGAPFAAALGADQAATIVDSHEPPTRLDPPALGAGQAATLADAPSPLRRSRRVVLALAVLCLCILGAGALTLVQQCSSRAAADTKGAALAGTEPKLH